MGRAKVLDQLRSQHNWIVSEKRLKDCMNKHNLNANNVEEKGIESVPVGAREAQMQYKKESGRYIKLYGKE